MPQSDEDFIKKSKYITDRVLVRAFFQWESFSPHPLNQKTRFSLIKGYFQTYNTKPPQKITNLGICELKTHLRPFAESHIKYVFHNPYLELDDVNNSTFHYVAIILFWSRM